MHTVKTTITNTIQKDVANAQNLKVSLSVHFSDLSLRVALLKRDRPLYACCAMSRPLRM
jgi:hypothetical protein